MLECNRSMRKKFALMTRVIAVLLPVVILTVLLSQSVFALNTYVINDGQMVAVYTTFATDPAEVLSEAGFELTPDDIYTTQTSSGKSEITIQRLQTITIRTPQTQLQLQSYGETVAELLDRAGIVLTEEDIISARLNSQTYDGMEITITSTQYVIEAYPIEIPYETLYCYVPNLPAGQQVVLSQGTVGAAERTANVLYIDGQEISRTTLSDTVITEPVREIVATSDAASASAAGISEQLDQLQQAALAGRPVICDGVIITPQGEVLTYSSSDIYKATAYNSTDPGCDMWTATGTMCRIGVVAVDPRLIPYGTQMYIVSNDGKYIYGISSAEDCGGAIKNKRIDLYFETVSDCLKFGVRDCTIYFLN